MIEILRRVVVAVLVAKGLNETGRVAGVGRGLAVADLSPHELAALATAAAEEQIVVDLVVGRGFRSVEHGRRCALQPDDNRRVLGIREDVPSQAIRLPPKVFRVVEATAYVLPLSSVRLQYVSIRRHTRKAQYRLSVGHIRPRKLVDGPVVIGQVHSPSRGPAPVEYAIHCLLASVCQPLNAHRL